VRPTLRKHETKKTTIKSWQSGSKVRKASAVERRESRAEGLKQEATGFQEGTAEREKKVDERIGRGFKFLLEEGHRSKLMRVTLCSLFCTVLLIMVILSVLIVSKYNNRQYYETAYRSSGKINDLVMLLIESATNLQLLNLYPKMPSVNSSYLFQ
jgi:hypothetical protein